MEKLAWTIRLCGVLCLLGFMDCARKNDSPEDVICQNGWSRIHRGCYLFVLAPDTWENALNDCKSLHGELVYIQSLKEKDDLEDYVKRSETEEPTDSLWWAGLKRDSQSGGDWRSLNGQPVSNLIHWSANNRKIQPGNMCGMLDITSGTVKLSSMRCNSTRKYICEFHSITKKPNTDVTTMDTIIRGATITDNNEITNHTGDHSGDGAIIGVSKKHGQKTTISGGLYNSMRTVLSNSDLNTSPQVASTQEDNTTVKLATTVDLPVSVTVSTTHIEDGVHKSELDTGRILDAGITFLASTTEKYDDTTSAPETTFVMEKKTSVKSSQPTSPATSQPTSPATSQPTSPATPHPTQPSWTRPDTPQPTMVDWEKAYYNFKGCYVPGTGGSLRDTVMAARSFYPDELQLCPKVKIGSISWDVVPAGQTANVSCPRGQGFATLHCGNKPVCWEGQPNILECVSKKLQAIVMKVEISDARQNVAPPSLEETVELSATLVEVVETERTTMEDVIVTSQVLTALTKMKDTVMATKQVAMIIYNVVKAGSILVSTNKSAMWEEMSQKDRVRSASSLLVAIETATVFMAERIDEPIVITKRDANIELELRVVDLEVLEKETNELVYNSVQSENSFSIPIEVLKSLSKGKLAKAVFFTHYSLSEIMSGRSEKRATSTTTQTNKYDSNNTRDFPGSKGSQDNNTEEKTGPTIASHILSASVVRDRSSVLKLPKPVSFTMKHLQEVDAKYIPLCSFWDIRQDTQLGFWSQDGCRVVHTNKSHTSCECGHMTNFAILLDIHGMQMSKVHQSLLRLVTIIGCIISCISLLVSWITFQCFPSLQGERNSIHKNLAFTLLVAEIVFVFGIDQASHQIACSVIAGFLHFFFLAAFMWMFIEGLHIIFMLVQVFDASRSRLPYYYLAAYGAPLVVVGISCIVYYRGYGTDEYCWLTTKQYFIWAFAGPVAIILLVNAVFLSYALSTVCRHADYVFSAKEKSNGSGIRTWVQGALALEVLLGLTWTLGYFLINDDSLPLAYAFAILNSLQGLFIFIFHCLLNKKAQKEYRQMVRTVVRRSQSSITTQSTITKRTHHTNNSHELNNSPTNSHQKLNATNSHSLA